MTFIPQPGRVRRVRWPTGPDVRVDGAWAEGGDVSPFYDSMVAKIIFHTMTRELAIERMLRALDETVIEGIGTNLPLQRRILDSDAFRTGQVDVHWLEEQLLADHRF